MRIPASMMFVVFVIAVLQLISSCAHNPLNDGKERTEVNKTEVEYTSDKPVVMFILDTSESMSDLVGGKTKIQTAERFIIDTISRIDRDRYNTGLITFSKGDTCQTEVAVPPTNNDPETIIGFMKTVVPTGATPLASAMAKSGTVLDKVQRNIVILFSDGVESCDGDPVREARLLDEKYGIQFNLQVIGYAVNETTERRLQQISQVSDQWAYHKVEDADALSAAIDHIIKQGDLLDPRWAKVNTFTLQFGSGSIELEKEHVDNINKIYAYLKNNGKRMEIIGHTDSLGSASRNMALSIERAERVKTKLIELGISANRIDVTGRGEEEPLSSNDTAAGRLDNRRVVIRLL